MAGIDAMGNLSRPSNQHENSSNDFKTWARHYLRVGSAITPADWWAARNAVLHTYGIDSRDSRKGKARRILWRLAPNQNVRVVQVRQLGNEEIIEVELSQVVDLFCRAVGSFVEQQVRDERSRQVLESRVHRLLMIYGPHHPEYPKVERYLG
jgi:hypothetical protein